jgi:hypothetical protein
MCFWALPDFSLLDLSSPYPTGLIPSHRPSLHNPKNHPSSYLPSFLSSTFLISHPNLPLSFPLPHFLHKYPPSHPHSHLCPLFFPFQEDTISFCLSILTQPQHDRTTQPQPTPPTPSPAPPPFPNPTTPRPSPRSTQPTRATARPSTSPPQ